MSNPQLRPAPAPAVEVEALDDDACLYRPDIDEVIVLNRSAADIWHLADGTHTIEDIARVLAAEYGESVEGMLRDVGEVVDDLLHRGYLADTGPSTP